MANTAHELLLLVCSLHGIMVFKRDHLHHVNIVVNERSNPVNLTEATLGYMTEYNVLASLFFINKNFSIR